MTDWNYDMDAAPMDGTPVLLYKPNERMVGEYMLAGYWGEWPGRGECWIACDGNPQGYYSSITQSKQGYPAAWMPLPSSPKGQSDEIA